MKIMVTGDLGYLGSVLVPILLNRDYEVVGFDIGYFADCLLCPVSENYERINKDIRFIDEGDLN